MTEVTVHGSSTFTDWAPSAQTPKMMGSKALLPSRLPTRLRRLTAGPTFYREAAGNMSFCGHNLLTR
jgi:hypothetical protein